jgi:2-methylisocitrate lyase-like PEP mutase family enzyme
MTARCEAFLRLHKRGSPLFLPNAWDYASAAVLVGAGYEAIGTTSLGVAAAAGKRDATGQTREETLALAGRLASLATMLTVDVESGFSDDPEEVADLACQLSSEGVVGINLEDGRPDGSLSSIDLHCAKIRAVKSRAPAVFVNARSDAFWLADAKAAPPVAETLRRAAVYVSAGADGIFVPGAADVDTIRMLGSRIAAPLNILYLPGQHTFRALAEAGAARVSSGSLLFREALRSVIQTAHDARTGAVTAVPDRPSYAQIQASIARR